mgnify:CR=1 FL=1
MKEFVLRLYTVFMIVLIMLAVIIVIGFCFGFRARILVTSSMEPNILKNSLVILNTSAPWDDLEEGNVIAFRANKTEVLHRITEVINKELIVTPDKGKGQATVSKSMYVGKEVMAFPVVGGWIRNVLEHWIWGVCLFAVGFVILGCLEGTL